MTLHPAPPLRCAACCVLAAAFAACAGPASAAPADPPPDPPEGAAAPPERMADHAPPRFGADRRREMDPAHDVGLLMPRADTMGAGRTGLRGTQIIGALTISHGLTDTAQISLSGIPIAALVTDTLPLALSAKWAFIRTPRLVVSAFGTLTGVVGEGGGFGPTLGVLVDGYVGTRLGLHASAVQPVPSVVVSSDGFGAAPFAAVMLTAGTSIRLTDWLFAIVDVHGMLGASLERVALAPDLVLLGGLRISGTHFALEAGVIATQDNAAPLLSWSWRG